jgi:FkbM family methyltransferase
VALRHPLGDVMALDKIFSQGEYEFPPAAASALGQAHEPLRVVDLGANVGLFGAWLLGRFPNAQILAVEADPETAAVHRLTIEANGLGHRWQLMEAFAGTHAGTARFVPGLFGLSHAADADDGIEVPVIDVMPHLLNADFVKIDIEGAEWPLVSDSRFPELSAAVVAFEYHARGCPTDTPRAAANEALRTAGYSVVPDRQDPLDDAGVLWGWRRS